MIFDFVSDHPQEVDFVENLLLEAGVKRWLELKQNERVKFSPNISKKPVATFPRGHLNTLDTIKGNMYSSLYCA